MIKNTKASHLTFLMICLSLLLSFTVLSSVNSAIPFSVFPYEGPHFSELQFKIYATSEAEVAGLLAGDIDMVDFFEAEQLPDIQDGLDDGSLLYEQSAEQGMWTWDLQNQRYPLNITDFRRAINHLVDKEYIVAEALQGLAYPLETFLGSPGYGPWAGTDYVTYEFNLTRAGEILDDLGFTKITSGPDEGWRQDPKTGLKMRELVIIARTEHAHRIFAARELAKWMDDETGIGIPYDLREVPRSVASPLVFVENDYDLYTGGWGGGPNIDWLWDLHHSDSPTTQNYILARNDTLDAELDKVKYGATFEEVLDGAQKAQRIISEQVVRIPVYAKAYIAPYNSRLENVVDLPWRSGITWTDTFLNAYDKDQKYGGVLNVGWTSDPQQPSPMYEINWWWDGMLNDVIYDYLAKADPTTFEPTPWLAYNWTFESWTAPGDIPGMKITFKIRDNATWHDGVPVTAEDVAFTWLYAQEQENPVYISDLLSLADAEAIDTYTAAAYFNSTSYWALWWVGLNIPIIPKHIWQDITDSVSYQPLTEGNLIGSGKYRFKDYRPGEYVLVEANPNYWLKPADSPLGYDTITLTKGDTKAFTQDLVIGETPIINGTYTLTVKTLTGAVVTTVQGTVATNGTYSAALDTTDIDPGTYLLFEELSANATAVGIGKTAEYQLTIGEAPLDYTLIIAAIVIVVVVIAAGYIVIRRR